MTPSISLWPLYTCAHTSHRHVHKFKKRHALEKSYFPLTSIFPISQLKFTLLSTWQCSVYFVVQSTVNIHIPVQLLPQLPRTSPFPQTESPQAPPVNSHFLVRKVTVLGFSDKWNHAVLFFWLAYFTLHSLLIHDVPCVHSYVRVHLTLLCDCIGFAHLPVGASAASFLGPLLWAQLTSKFLLSVLFRSRNRTTGSYSNYVIYFLIK